MQYLQSNILAYLFVYLAANFNAICETLSFHFKTSVFQDKDPKKWNPNVDWQYINNFLGIMRIEPYHISKTIQLILLAWYGHFHTQVHFDISLESIFYLSLDTSVFFFSWFVGFEPLWRILKRPYKETTL